MTAVASQPMSDIPIRSDNLRGLREIFSAFPFLVQQFGSPKDFRLVLDASVVIADLRWLVKKRETSSARTALQEALDSGVLVGFAPSFLDEEIRQHLPRLAQEEKISHERLTAEWERYKSGLTFFDAPRKAVHADKNVVDPKDVPYILTYSAVGARAIMTEDPHLERMGAQTVALEVAISIRDYARDVSVDLSIRTYATLLGAVVVGSLVDSIKLSNSLVSRLPKPLQMLVLVGIVAALSNKEARDRVFQTLRNVQRVLTEGGSKIAPVVSDLAHETERRRRRAAQVLSNIESRLTTPNSLSTWNRAKHDLSSER